MDHFGFFIFTINDPVKILICHANFKMFTDQTRENNDFLAIQIQNILRENFSKIMNVEDLTCSICLGFVL